MKNQTLKLSALIISISFTTMVSFGQVNQPTIKKSVFFGKSKPLNEMKIVIPGKHAEKKSSFRNELPWDNYKNFKNAPVSLDWDMQKKQGGKKGKGPLLNFEGVSNVNNVGPGDPNGDIGSNHYVQSVNASFAVWDKMGNLLYGPADYKSLWDAIPGPWNNVAIWADPVFKYDQLADRWFISAMALDFNANIFHEMVAVSVTSDPLGEYYCYAFEFDQVNDYPKVAIWPDGYYLNYNMFTSNWEYIESVVTVIDREAMLSGESEITMIQFVVDFPSSNISRICPLSADFKGSLLPEESTNFVVLAEMNFANYNYKLNIYDFDADWVTPENSTFELVTQIDFGQVPAFSWGSSAPQPGNFQDVETWIYRLMYPLSYRKFEDHESMVACHTMLNEDNIHFIKWYELRKQDSTWFVYQTGNYSPDAESRYEPSISINGNGDIAIGYTKSSLELYPSIFITGRRADDPLGEMTYEEIGAYMGLNYVNIYNSSNGRNRWGDYTSMVVDPVDDSTFWYTSTYPISSSGWGNWSSRVVAFNLTEEINNVTAYAGADTIICEIELFTTEGEATNYNYLEWSSSGDGNFITNHEPVAKYLRGNQDIENGQVTLTLYATGYESGTETEDSMVLYINHLTEVDAGPNDTLFIGDSYTLQGEVQFSNDYYWTTEGDGTFNDETLLDAIYTPGNNDILNGEVHLTLNANPIEPCPQGDEDEMKLTIIELTGIDKNFQTLMINVSPNPTSGVLSVEGMINSMEIVKLQLYNSIGEILFYGEFEPGKDKFNKQIDLSLLTNGVYYLKLTNGTDVKTIKVIKK